MSEEEIKEAALSYAKNRKSNFFTENDCESFIKGVRFALSKPKHVNTVEDKKNEMDIIYEIVNNWGNAMWPIDKMVERLKSYRLCIHSTVSPSIQSDMEKAANEMYPLDNPRKNMFHDNPAQTSKQKAFMEGYKAAQQAKPVVNLGPCEHLLKLTATNNYSCVNCDLNVSLYHSPVNPSLQSGVEEAAKEAAKDGSPFPTRKQAYQYFFKAGAVWQAQQVKQPITGNPFPRLANPLITEDELQYSLESIKEVKQSDMQNITRFEVIDDAGRAYVYRGQKKSVDISIQDEGRTLKVFISGKP